ncbi:hypothetical protein BOTNAR_0100g00140 [Botryotinia narcissicola]|uniref:RING-type domain-containing protein n=1 Tax=Botryotinia narcissicola TaxID=278944 RepID=A0A4Z1IRZ7_9HELO|nr:hypothetical protein BOTNAR_0100g00140 [Botryotinia narcissicola]
MPPPPHGQRLSHVERVAYAQEEWRKWLSLRKMRLKFVSEETVDAGGFDIYEFGENYFAKEAKLDRLLLLSEGTPHRRQIQSYIESSNKAADLFTDKGLLRKEGGAKDTLGLLGMLAAANVDDKYIDSFVEDLTAYGSAWLYSDEFEGHKADWPPWVTGQDDASLQLQRYHNMVHALASDRNAPSPWKHLNAMFRLNGYLMTILRFVDERNAHLGGRPALPDGSNIADPAIKAAWLLHYRSLRLGGKTRGIDSLKNILIIGRAQLEQETRSVPVESRKIYESLLEFITTLQTLTTFLQALANEFSRDSIPRPGCQEPYIISDFNIDSDRVSAAWAQITHPTKPDPLGRTINPFGPMLLWSQLLDRAADFEAKNNRYYVEDHLYDNRVIAEDEHWEITKLISQANYDPDFIKDRIPDVAQAREVRALTKKVSQVNTHRRNYLLLRDWSKKRPWKQLYFVFDTVTTDTWRGLIDDFYNTMELLKVLPETPEKEQDALDYRASIEADPESEANLFGNVFPIHPLPSHDPCKYAGAYFGNYVYCLEDYAPRELWVQFFCNHMVHYDCGRDYWDNPGNPDFRCPLCRHTQSWELHKVADIVPEAVDLWDNVDLVDAAEVSKHPIVQMEGTPADVEGFKELYWESEAAHLAQSESWEFRNYHHERPRELHHEMAQMRNARRRRVLAARDERLEREKEFPTLLEE